MTSVFQGLLPMRRRARSTDTLSPRFGDVSISAPNEGSWYSQRQDLTSTERLGANTNQFPASMKGPATLRSPDLTNSTIPDIYGEVSVARKVTLRQDQDLQNGRSPALEEGYNTTKPPSSWTRNQYTLDDRYTSPRMGSMLSPVDETFAKQVSSTRPLPVATLSPENVIHRADQASPPLSNRSFRSGKHAAGLLQATMTSQGQTTKTSQSSEAFLQSHPHEKDLSTSRQSSTNTCEDVVDDADHILSSERAQDRRQAHPRQRAPSMDELRPRTLSNSQPVVRQYARSTSANPITRRRILSDESLDQLLDMPPLSATSGTSYGSSTKSECPSGPIQNKSPTQDERPVSDSCRIAVAVDSPRSLHSATRQPVSDATLYDTSVADTSDGTLTERLQEYEEQFQKLSGELGNNTASFKYHVMPRIASKASEQESFYQRSLSYPSSRRAASETRRPRHIYDDIEADYARLKQDFLAKPIAPDVSLTLPRLKKKKPKATNSSSSKEGLLAGRLSPLMARNQSGAKEAPRSGFTSPNPSLRSWAASESESRGPKMVPSYEELWC